MDPLGPPKGTEKDFDKATHYNLDSLERITKARLKPL